MPSLRRLLKRHLPGLHGRLAPLYWGSARPFLMPLVEQRIAAALRAAEREPRWEAVVEALAVEPCLRLAPRDRYAGFTRALAAEYVQVGLSALENVRAALEETCSGVPRRVLDLPCGHGRVLRFLRAAFPAAHITACDLDCEMVDFCVEAFDAHGVYSKDSPHDLDLGEPHDLVWCGSLLTHLEIVRWPQFLELFHRALRPGGLLLFSTQGEHAADRIRKHEFDYQLTSVELQSLLRGYEETGFGFTHYPGSDAYYGVSLSSPERVTEQVEGTPGLRVVSHWPRGWADHQDVFVCERSG